MNCSIVKAGIKWCESAPHHFRYHAPGKGGGPNSCVNHTILNNSDDAVYPASQGTFQFEAAQLHLCTNTQELNGDCDFDEADAVREVTMCDQWASATWQDKFMAEMLKESWY